MDEQCRQLIQEFSKPNPNLATVGKLVQQCLNMDISDKNIKAYQSVLEIGCLWAAHTRNGVCFERYFSQLSSIIYLSAGQELEDVESERKWLLIGLQLLNLLVTGRVSEFHMLLEQLPESTLTSNPFILFPLKLEQSLIEGTYLRILESKKSVPSPEYSWFIDGLIDTIRNEIIRCIEASLDSLDMEKLSCFLFFAKTERPALKSVADQRGWKIGPDKVHFGKVNDSPNDFDASRNITRVLEYARHIEQII
jgi:26S proteasome regulatory subunit N12